MAKRKRIKLQKLTKTEEKLAVDLFNRVMHDPIQMPHDDFATFEAKFREANGEMVAAFGNNRAELLERIETVVATHAGFEERIARVQEFELPRHMEDAIGGMIAMSYSQMMRKHYPELDPKYVAPVKPFDPFDL